MKGRILLGGALVAAMLAFVVIVAVVRAKRPVETAKTSSVEKPKAKAQEVPRAPAPVEPEVQVRPDEVNAVKQGVALHDATLLGLIQNAKVAQQKGDTATRDAMLAGLKKQPARSRELLAREISKSKDYTVSWALQELMKELQ